MKPSQTEPVLWAPEPDAAAEPVLARVAELLAGSATAGVVLQQSGLLPLLLPRRVGRPVPVSVACAALEALSATQPRLALALGAALAGGTALLRLGAPGQRRDGVAPVLAGDRPAPLLAVAEARGLKLQAVGAGWHFDGEVRVFAGAEADRCLVFLPLAMRSRAAPEVLSCSLDRLESSVLAGVGWQRLSLCGPVDVATAPGRGDAALAEAQTVLHIAVAALGTGIGAAAFELARKAATATTGMTGEAASLARLPVCATRLSAARMMVHEAARKASAGQSGATLSAMALLAVHECLEAVMSTAALLAGAHADADSAALRHLLAGYRLQQQAMGGSAWPQALLVQALRPAGPEGRSGQPGRSGAAAHADETARSGELSPLMFETMSRPMNRRSAEPSDRVYEILDAAADAFTRQSYDATTLDYIGDVIGVTKGSIYYHYRSKADLFVAVYRRAMEMNIDTVEPIARQPGVRAIDRLYRMAYAHALQVMKHLSYQRLAVQGLEAQLMGRVNDEQRAGLEAVFRLRDRYEALFVDTLRQAIDDGDLPAQDARLAVKPLFGAINWTTMWYQPRPGETSQDRDRIATQLARFVVSGLTLSHQPSQQPRVTEA